VTPATTTPEVIVRQTLYAGDRLFMNDDEREVGRWIGDRRFGINRSLGYVSRVEQKADLVHEHDLEGGITEVAFASRLNLYPKLQFNKYYGHDLRLPAGDLLSVSWDMPGRCLVDCKREREHRERGTEAPVLHLIAAGELRQLVFAGWCTHAEALTGYIDNFGRGPCYVQTQLHPELQILTVARGAGWRGGEREPCAFDFGG
jgi:hypothetical protein